MTAALINVPKKAKSGDVIEIKTLMSHVMETGYRRTTSGGVVPRDIITSFTCRYNGVEIFRADLFPALASEYQNYSQLVIQAYQESTYPVSLEVFEISDAGMRAVGAFEAY